LWGRENIACALSAKRYLAFSLFMFSYRTPHLVTSLIENLVVSSRLDSKYGEASVAYDAENLSDHDQIILDLCGGMLLPLVVETT
jgi:hypothetical protein